MPTSPDVEQSALQVLQGKENPFECLARPQTTDDDFVEYDVPELLQEQRQLLLEIIDAYRVPTYTGSADLRASRVVTIRGPRGAGKTHLLQAVPYRNDSKAQILVRPSYFPTDVSFEEFLLSQLRVALVEKDEARGRRPLDVLAEIISRRLLLHGIRSLGATDRMFATPLERWARFKLLWGGGDRHGQRFDGLAEALASPESDTAALVARHGFRPEQCVRVVQGHLRTYECGNGPLPVIRRRLYEAMARHILLRDEEPLTWFLEGGYTEPATTSASRFEMVNQLLTALIEVCAIAGLPIVFAFDNLERLFSPANELEKDRVRAFLHGLAQGVDTTKGLLFLVFAEGGLFTGQVVPQMDEFARSRLEQGVALPGRNPIHLIDLKPPTLAEFHQLVRSRVRQQLAGFPRVEDLPDTFPFRVGSLEQLAQGAASLNLRNMLVRIRDEYSQAVYQKIGPGLTIDLEATWKKLLIAVGRRLSDSAASHRQALHAGLGLLLQKSLPLQNGPHQLWRVQPTVTVGEHEAFGLVTLLDWRVPPGESDRDGTVLQLGVGLFLAKAKGMPGDLDAKFDFFADRTDPARRLVVLWYTACPEEDLVEALPNKTRQVWDQSKFRDRTTLRRVGKKELCMMLAVPEWLNAIQEGGGKQVVDADVRDFLQKQCDAVYQLVAPKPVRTGVTVP